MQAKIVQGDLFYHSVHGMCRVNEVIKQNLSSKEGPSYALVPKLISHNKVRFVIGSKDMEISGFHAPVTVKEAGEILEYLKARVVDKTSNPTGNAPKAGLPDPDHSTWALAKAILSFSHDKSEARDQRKRQMLERSAKGLIGELAFVLEIPLKDAAARVRKSLERSAKINPLVLAALTRAVED